MQFYCCNTCSLRDQILWCPTIVILALVQLILFVIAELKKNVDFIICQTGIVSLSQLDMEHFGFQIGGERHWTLRHKKDDGFIWIIFFYFYFLLKSTKTRGC